MEAIPSLWGSQDISIEDRLLFTTLQLEQARVSAEETIRDLSHRLEVTTKERDAALEKFAIILSYCKQQFLLPISFPASPAPCGTSSITADSDSHPSQLSTHSPTASFLDSAVSLSSQPELLSAPAAAAPKQPVAEYDYADAVIDRLASVRPLPQQGKLIQAMHDAPPPLSALLISGNLPQWRNPPPVQPLQSIPPLPFKACVSGNTVSGPLGYQKQPHEVPGTRVCSGPLSSSLDLMGRKRAAIHYDSTSLSHLHPNKLQKPVISLR